MNTSCYHFQPCQTCVTPNSFNHNVEIMVMETYLLKFVHELHWDTILVDDFKENSQLRRSCPCKGSPLAGFHLVGWTRIQQSGRLGIRVHFKATEPAFINMGLNGRWTPWSPWSVKWPVINPLTAIFGWLVCSLAEQRNACHLNGDSRVKHAQV